ncbi:hypothetical protein MMC18_000714 [Xylographa bjoerkii]|nr:hypothetical protein [Xylographa bjoerkii]
MSTTSTTTSSPTVGPSTQSLSPGADAGIAIGATLLLLVLALVIWFLVRRRRRQKEGHAGIALVEEQAGAYEKAELDASVERAEFGNSPLPQGNELEGSENERRELGASGAIPELAGEERVELPARGSVRYEAP